MGSYSLIYSAVRHSSLLFTLGVRNEHCSVCAIGSRNDVTALPHQCYHSWSATVACKKNFPQLRELFAKVREHLIKVREVLFACNAATYLS